MASASARPHGTDGAQSKLVKTGFVAQSWPTPVVAHTALRSRLVVTQGHARLFALGFRRISGKFFVGGAIRCDTGAPVEGVLQGCLRILGVAARRPTRNHSQHKANPVDFPAFGAYACITVFAPLRQQRLWAMWGFGTGGQASWACFLLSPARAASNFPKYPQAQWRRALGICPKAARRGIIWRTVL